MDRIESDEKATEGGAKGGGGGRGLWGGGGSKGTGFGGGVGKAFCKRGRSPDMSLTDQWRAGRAGVGVGDHCDGQLGVEGQRNRRRKRAARKVERNKEEAGSVGL